MIHLAALTDSDNLGRDETSAPAFIPMPEGRQGQGAGGLPCSPPAPVYLVNRVAGAELRVPLQYIPLEAS
jgi:hypothetical protein